jgi:hypothetical protein
VVRACFLLAALWAGTSVAQDVWTVQNSGRVQNLWGACFGGGQFVAVGEGGSVLTSPDGRAWTARTSGTTHWLTAVCYSEALKRFVAVGEAGTTLLSSDGVTWTMQSTGGAAMRLNAVSSAWGRFTAVGENAVFAVSEKGESWFGLDLAGGEFTAWMRGLAHGDAGFYAVGQDGRVIRWVQTGPGFEVWRTKLGTDSLEGVACGNGLVVAVGARGAIWRWSDPRGQPVAVKSGVVTGLNAVMAANNEFVAAGDNGVVLTSGDALGWTPRATPTVRSLRALAASDTAMVAVGFDGVIVRSDYAARVPQIFLPPVDTVEQAGSTVRLVVAASGSGPLAFQWMFNGAPIAGATGTALLVPQVNTAQAGSYVVQVSNAVGRVTSRVARLAVVDLLPAGTVDPAFVPTPAPSGAVRVIAPQPNGSVIIAGDFVYTRPDGTRQSGVARLLANGQYDPTYTGLAPTNDPLHGATVPAGNPPASSQFQFPFTASAAVRLPDGSALIGGTEVNTYPYVAVARALPDNRWDPAFPPVTSLSGAAVQDMKLLDSGEVAVVVYGNGGSRLPLPGNPPTVRRLKANLKEWSDYLAAGVVGAGPGASLLYADGRAVMAANFDALSAKPTGAVWNSVLRFNADGTIDNTFLRAPGIDGSAYVLAAAADGGVYLGGAFATVAGVSRPRLAKLNATSTNPNAAQLALRGPRYIEVPSGGNFTLSADVAGTGPLQLLWRSGNLDSRFQSSTTNTLTVTRADARFTGVYWLTASGPGGPAVSDYVFVRVVASAPPVIALTPPATASVNAGRDFTLNLQVNDPADVSYQWYFNGVALEGQTGSALMRTNVARADAGVYAVVASNRLGAVRAETAVAIVETPVLVNLSTRAAVGAAEQSLIIGFTVNGSKDLVVRGVGPALASAGVTAPLADPRLAVRDAAGRLIAQNDNWEDGAGAKYWIQETGLPLANFSKDAGYMGPFPAGGCTMQIDSAGGADGVALGEVSETRIFSLVAKLTNLSARAFVGAGENIAIAGFVLQGAGRARLLVRAVGPGLAEFGVAGVLANPVMVLTDERGRALFTNDDWGTPTGSTTVASVAAQVGAFPLREGSRDAARVVELAAGAYTVQVSGVGGTTGIALLELYEVP